MSKAIMLCLSTEQVQEWVQAQKGGDTDFVFDRKNVPSVGSDTKIYLYCVRDGLVTTVDEDGNELWIRGNAVGQGKQFYNGKVFGECEYVDSTFSKGHFYWRTKNNVAYAQPKPIWDFTQYGKESPMYRAISDWCYVEVFKQ